MIKGWFYMIKDWFHMIKGWFIRLKVGFIRLKIGFIWLKVGFIWLNEEIKLELRNVLILFISLKRVFVLQWNSSNKFNNGLTNSGIKLVFILYSEIQLHWNQLFGTEHSWSQ